MLGKLRNRGIHFLNQELAPQSATIIIVGLPRSGTSMVASVLGALGIFLGDRADDAVFEDVRLASALENGYGDPVSIVEEYNGRFDYWALKRPSAFEYIEEFIPIFRDPRFIITFRDPLAVAKRNEISTKADFRKQLILTSKKQCQLVNFALTLQHPVMLVSYEKAVNKPAFFVNSVADFSGQEVDQDLRKRAIDVVRNGPDHYLRASQTRFARNEFR